MYEGGTGGSLDDLSFPGDTLDDLAFHEGTGNSRNDVPFLEGILNDVTLPEGTGGYDDLLFPSGTGDISNGISVTERTDIQLNDIVNNNKYSSKVQPTAGEFTIY